MPSDRQFRLQRAKAPRSSTARPRTTSTSSTGIRGLRPPPSSPTTVPGLLPAWTGSPPRVGHGATEDLHRGDRKLHRTRKVHRRGDKQGRDQSSSSTTRRRASLFEKDQVGFRSSGSSSWMLEDDKAYSRTSSSSRGARHHSGTPPRRSNERHGRDTRHDGHHPSRHQDEGNFGPDAHGKGSGGSRPRTGGPDAARGDGSSTYARRRSARGKPETGGSLASRQEKHLRKNSPMPRGEGIRQGGGQRIYLDSGNTCVRMP
jgi:hypothetical protein